MRRLIITITLIMSMLMWLGQGALCVKKPDPNQGVDKKDYILIITSYAHDSKLVSEFTEAFEIVSMKCNIEIDTKIESMGILSLNNCNDWKNMMRQILGKHLSNKPRGIILIGQEAWGTYLSLESPLGNVPIYGYKVNETWVKIPDSIPSIRDWTPTQTSSHTKATEMGSNGAILNNFDFSRNFELIKKHYPKVKNIALLTDNTYGGLCVQTEFRKVTSLYYKEINPILLDGRKLSANEIQGKIDSLPQNTVLMLGTWRVGRSGSFYLDKILLEMTANRPDIPIFSLTGLGLRNTAICGFVPMFGAANMQFLETVIPMLDGKTRDTIFIYNKNQYQYNLARFDEMGLNRLDIPQDAIYVDSSTVELEKYKNIIFLSTVFAVMAVMVVFVMIFLHKKIRAQNKLLSIQTEELKAAKENAEKSDKLKSAFLANISHEIRTPMNAIMGFASMIHEADGDTLLEYQKYITENGKILLDLLTQTVEYSKVDSGIVEFSMAQINVSRIFQDIHTRYQPKIPKGIGFNSINPCDNCTIVYDSDKLSWMITILLDNAIKFIRKGSIEMGYLFTEDKFYLYVSDTGIGIAEENQKRIFDRFEKLDSFSQGAGLGLSLIKAIVEKSDGHINVISRPDIGSRFIIELPCRVSEPLSGYATQEQIQELYDPATLLKSELNTSLKILVAEDSAYNYALVEQIMKNHQLIHVANGREAVQAMKKDWYDLVLMDIRMPEMDGLTATQEIRKFDKQTPIIAVTAFTFDNNYSKAINAGCNDFLEKPFTRGKIYSSILKLMQK